VNRGSDHVGAGRKEVLAAFHLLNSAMNRFQPELVLISAGFDARHGDLLGRLELTDSDYTELTDFVLDLAHLYANGHVVSVLEGGYSLPGHGPWRCHPLRAIAAGGHGAGCVAAGSEA